MLGAFKFWNTKQNSPKCSPRNLKRTTSLVSMTSSVDDVDKSEMSNYGHLLTCALCRELFTHPVLLPCQHSMCYGCARAQIIDPIMTSLVEENRNESLVDDDAISVTSLLDVTSRQNSFSESLDLTHNRSQGGASPKFRSSSRVTSPVDRFHGDESFDDAQSPNASIVLSTKDFLHFKQVTPQSKASKTSLEAAGASPHNQSCCVETKTPQGRNVKRPSSASCGRKSFLKSSKNMTSSSNLLRNSTGKVNSSLRRSSSTSSLVRASLRHQQSYECLKRSKVKNLFCPSCDRNVELGSLGISGLFRNFALESIVERFRSKAKAAVAIRCGYCKPPAADATKSCLDCKLSYCNECFKIVHIWGTKKAQHDYVGPTNNFSRPKVLLCPEHNQEAVTMYCNKCKKSVCRMCKVGGGNHVNHPVSSAKSAFREGRERLCADLEILKQKKEKVNAKIESLGEAFKELERKESVAREEIHTSIDEMHRLLEVKRNDLLGKAECRMRDEEKRMRAELQKLYTKQMYTGVTSFAEEVLKETDPNYFLQNIRMVEFRVREAIDLLPGSDTEEEEVSGGSLDLHLNITKVKNQLDAMHFIDVPGTPIFKGSDVSTPTTPTIRWVASSSDDVIEYYEAKFVAHGMETRIEKSAESNFAVPDEFRATDCDVTVRGVNKAGPGEWSEIFQWKGKRGRHFKLVSESDERDVTIESSGLTAKFRSSIFSVLKGDVGLWNGDHEWQVSVTSHGPSDVIVGVSALCPRDKNGLHGSESPVAKTKAVASDGAYMHITPASAHYMSTLPRNYRDDSAGLRGSKAGGNSEEDSISIARHFRVAMTLQIRTGNEATVVFYDVIDGEKKPVLEKYFGCSVPVWPIVLAKGDVTVVIE